MNFRQVGIPILLLISSPADTRVVKVEAEAPTPVSIEAGKAAYERVNGIFHGELDPSDPANRIITDLAIAPRNARGLVEYRANLTIMRPIDPAKRTGVLYYYVPNRGGQPQPGPFDEGHTIVYSGWQGDIAEKPGVYWAALPAAQGVSGKLLVRLLPFTSKTTFAINAGLTSMSPRPLPETMDVTRAQLVMERKGKPDQIIPSADWAFSICDVKPFPGEPDPKRICLRKGVDPEAAYRLSYIARNPPVLGIGWAATRDLVSHLRKSEALKWAVGVGDSQSGNFLRSFVHLGFNADEQGKQVFDGINPNIAARQLVLNLRFGAPSGAAGKYEPGSEGVLWWGDYADRMRKLLRLLVRLKYGGCAHHPVW
jgi:Alpha/beta hydrolase domain